MGQRRKLWISCIVSAVVTLACLVFVLRPQVKDEFENVVMSQGFLKAAGDGLDNYIEAMRILGEQSVAVDANNMTDVICEAIAERFSEAVLAGAKCREVGIKGKWRAPYSFDLVSPNGQSIKMDDLKRLIYAVNMMSGFECERGRVAEGRNLAMANLALGVQLGTSDIDFVQMVGIGCKSMGLRGLNRCGQSGGSMVSTERLTKVLEKQCETVKKDSEGFRNKVRLRYGI
jgi:hypothetical protein